MSATEALLAASCLHAGFSVVVTAVVYPALVSAPDFAASHAAHSRRISWVVAPLYLLVASACLWSLLSSPSPLALVAVAGNAGAALATALVAGPTHGRLGRAGPEPALVRRLLVSDRVRTACAVVAAGAALAARAG